jgi:hypothetical protein
MAAQQPTLHGMAPQIKRKLIGQCCGGHKQEEETKKITATAQSRLP